jgi:hypothetical protein
MKQLLIIATIIVLFINCNNSSGSSGWSAPDRQRGLKECMNEVEGKVDEAVAKKYCGCVLDKAMKKYATYAEAEKGTEAEGTELAKACLGVVQGNGEVNEDNGKGGGIFGGGSKEIEGGGGRGWSKSDKNGFLEPCESSLTQNGYSGAQSRQLCNCILQKLEKKYTNLQDANDRGGEAAGAQLRQECEGGGGTDDNDNDYN